MQMSPISFYSKFSEPFYFSRVKYSANGHTSQSFHHPSQMFPSVPHPPLTPLQYLHVPEFSCTHVEPFITATITTGKHYYPGSSGSGLWLCLLNASISGVWASISPFLRNSEKFTPSIWSNGKTQENWIHICVTPKKKKISIRFGQ